MCCLLFNYRVIPFKLVNKCLIVRAKKRCCDYFFAGKSSLKKLRFFTRHLNVGHNAVYVYLKGLNYSLKFLGDVRMDGKKDN